MKHCPHGHRPLIAIDPYGERLTGYLEGNRWGRPADHTLPMLFDLEALRARQERSGAG